MVKVKNKRKSREERIEEIRVAAIESFIKKGYQNTTMEDIISLTELSKGGFYHYYSSKKEILLDIMKDSNILYINYDENMVKLNKDLSFDEKKKILIDAILDKFIYTSDLKLLYTIFACEIHVDPELLEAFMEFENTFFKFLGEKIGVNVDENIEIFKLVSRSLNGLIFSQNLFKETDIFSNNREAFKKFYEPIIDDILKRT
ncbi:MAG: TetR/AcrR family transcriptional regulator [Firmicutes bacterium]|jgi:AcrR family transcriptional regulator|nr:TetR/AcrR family transcriptional regulator [Bacillota bacterium]